MFKKRSYLIRKCSEADKTCSVCVGAVIENESTVISISHSMFSVMIVRFRAAAAGHRIN